MRNIFIFCCIIIGFCFAEETRRVYLKKISIAEKKSNGKAWDFVGKQPDVKIDIFYKTTGNWQKIFTSNVFSNKNEIEQIINTGFDIPVDSYIKMRLEDVDSLQSDLIGSYEFKISSYFPSEEREVSFDNVTSLVFFVSKYKSIDEHEKAAQGLIYEKKIKEYEQEDNSQWKKAYEDKVKDYETLKKQQQDSSQWKTAYEDKVKDYETLKKQQQSNSPQQGRSKWKTAYEDKVKEYEALKKQQQDSSKWKTAYEDKVKEYEALKKQQQDSSKWKTAYEDKAKEYEALKKQQRDSSQWKIAYENKVKEYEKLQAKYASGSTSDKTASHSDSPEKIVSSQEVTKQEKEARTKLDGIFRWTASSYTKKNASRMQNYYKKAVPFAEILSKYPSRNKKHLDLFEQLKNDTNKAVNAEKEKQINSLLIKTKYYLKKNNEWLQYYKDNPKEIDKMEPYNAKNAIEGFSSNLQLGWEQFQKLEKKHGPHPILDTYKVEWKNSEKKVHLFVKKLSVASTMNYFAKNIQEQQTRLASEINKYNEESPSTGSFEYCVEKWGILEKEAVKSVGTSHDIYKKIKENHFEAKKWLVTAYCDQGIQAKKDNNKYYMKQSFDAAQKIVDGDSRLQKIYSDKTNVTSGLAKADKELKTLKQNLLQRVEQASKKLNSSFDTYQKSFEPITPKRKYLLENLDTNKGKALANANFDSLGWSKNGWYLEHDGMFSYNWDPKIWKIFRKIELEHYKIFRAERERILKKHNLSHLGADGRIDWSFPGLKDVTLLAVVETTSSYTGRIKIRDAYGRVTAYVDEKPIRVISVRILGIKSKYFTVWLDQNSHENLDLKGVVSEY